MAGPISLEDIGYADLPEVNTAPTGPRSLQDLGYDVQNAETGQPVQTPANLGISDQEAQFIQDYIARQPDPRSWGQMASDTWSNIKDAASYFAPEAVGGSGGFRISQVPGAVAQGIVEGVQAPGKLASGEVPMFDAQGYPRQEAIAEGLKFTGVASPGRSAMVSPTGVTRAMPLSELTGRRQIAKAIEADIQQGKSRGMRPGPRTSYGPRMLPGASPEQLAILGERGIPVSAYDLSGGPNMRGLVETASDKAHDTKQAVAIQHDIANRAANTGQYIAASIDELAGKPLATGDEFKAAVDAISATNDPNYKRVMGLPEHQQVFSPELKSLLENRPVFRTILKERAEGAVNRGQQPPPIYGGRGNLNIQPFNAPSLEYLDEVYRDVRNKATAAFEAGDSVRGNDYKSAANALRNELDKVAAKDPNGNSTYKSIRDDASEVFGGKNALEAGYKFARMADPLKLNEVQSNFARYSPSQKDQFRTGLLANLKDEALKSPAKVTSYFDGSNPRMFDKIASVIGVDEATRLGNQVRIQKIVNETQAPVLSPEAAAKGARGIGFPAAAGIGTFGLVAGEKLAENLPQIANVIGSPITQGAAVAGSVAATAYGAKKLFGAVKNAYEARVAQAVLDAVSTRDPAAMAALERMPPKTVSYFISKLENLGQRATIGAAGEAGDQPENDYVITGRPGRKSGGRVKTNPISAEVKRVRTLLSQKTASMLSIPDDAIATALHLAKRT